MVCTRKDCTWEHPVKCQDCNRTCRSSDCFTNHRQVERFKNGPSIGEEKLSKCQQYFFCQGCKKLLDTLKRSKEDHICGEWQCRLCQDYFSGQHLCYMRASKQKVSKGKFIYFDFESTQDKNIPM